ncbi:Beta-propeller domains of methanol dehydrogenase type [plant metagenome]|uniref:Beta-propeller domains of methanol dehydrogenase type n=1 Tax=plant metagenome TaxID=1297885 RepID=A0A484PXC2_9ZZZZ
MRKTFGPLLATFIGLFWCLAAAAQYTVDTLPSPKARGQDHYVSDPDGNLGAGTVAQIDALGKAIEAANGSEFAVVVVNDYEGDSDFAFAMDLFSHWGIGKQGADNGLLLFLAMDRREYRFITGYGLEGILPDALLGRIGESYLVPYLKDGNTDMAVLSAAKAVESVFLSPDNGLELAGLQAYRPTFWNRHAVPLRQTCLVLGIFTLAAVWMRLARKRVLKKHGFNDKQYSNYTLWFTLFTFLFVMFLSGFVIVFMEKVDSVYRMRNLPWFAGVFGVFLVLYQYYGSSGFLRKITRDEKTSLDMRVSFARLSLVPLLLSPLAYRAYFELARHSRHARQRDVPPAKPGTWTRIHRDTLKRDGQKKYLSEQQMKEEKIRARSFEIWQDETGGIEVIAFAGDKASSFEECPKCKGLTLGKPEIKVREAATRSKTGTGEKIQSCEFCSFKVSLGMVVLARLSDPSSSSGSSGRGGGGGSSGGSFGGGSSGGGGAGGRW